MSEVRKAQIKLNMAKAKETHKTQLKSMTDRLKNVSSSKPMSELNKYTLARYQIKAAPDLATRSMDQGSGIEGKRTAANRRKIVNRSVGIGRAANKLTQKTNEDQQVDELNVRTMRSYKDKAEDDLIDKGQDMKSATPAFRKRQQGIARAADKIQTKKIQQRQNFAKRNFGGRVVEDNDLQKVLKDLQAAIQGVKKHAKSMNEDGHQDVASARRKAVLIMEDAAQLLMKLKNMDPNDSLPSWWMNKMSVTAAYMDSMRNYLLVPSMGMEDPDMGMPDMSTESNHDGLDYSKAKITVIPPKMPKRKLRTLSTTTQKERQASGQRKGSASMTVDKGEKQSLSSRMKDFAARVKNRDLSKLESYSMASSDTNVADKYRKKVIPQQVSEKKKKKKVKLVPMGPTSFGTGSYDATGGGDASVGEQTDKEKMKNIDDMMKMYKNRKPLSATVKMGQGMKRLKSKLDAIPSTDKAGRVSRSRIQKKFGSNVLQN